MSLSTAERMVATALGVPLGQFFALKRAHGKGGLAGKDLMALKSPFPPAGKFRPLNPGLVDDKDVRTVIEPENSDDEDVRRPDGSIGRPVQGLGMGVVYPDGATNRTRAANADAADFDANIDAALRRKKKKEAK